MTKEVTLCSLISPPVKGGDSGCPLISETHQALEFQQFLNCTVSRPVQAETEGRAAVTDATHARGRVGSGPRGLDSAWFPLTTEAGPAGAGWQGGLGGAPGAPSINVTSRMVGQGSGPGRWRPLLQPLWGFSSSWGPRRAVIRAESVVPAPKTHGGRAGECHRLTPKASLALLSRGRRGRGRGQTGRAGRKSQTAPPGRPEPPRAAQPGDSASPCATPRELMTRGADHGTRGQAQHSGLLPTPLRQR